jgi:N-acetylglutamate synthase-like GNAT family acetyltransferase
MTLIIRPAAVADYRKAIELLKEAGLPVADLKVKHLALAAEYNDVFQGLIGLEALGEIALLRSLVVSSDARGRGIGAALVAALETACVADAVRELWLLTTDADEFFMKQGYAIRERTDVPDAIRTTEEFSSLCPGTAVVMSKSLR